MADLKPMTCPNCGAPINTNRHICEYCGTKFKDVRVNDALPTLHYAAPRPGIKILKAKRIVDFWQLRGFGGEDEFEQYVREDLAHALASKIAESMDIKTMHRLDRMEVEYVASIRVLDPEYRF